MTKEEYIKKVYNEKWICDVVTFDYNDGLKYYIGLKYDNSWPEQGWFHVLMKVYKDPNYEEPTLYQNVQVYSDYINKHKATEEEQKLLIEELYKKNWKVIRKEDDWGFGIVEYEIKPLEKEN